MTKSRRFKLALFTGIARIDWEGLKQVGLEKPDDIVGITDYDLPWLEKETGKFLNGDMEIMITGIPKLNIKEIQHPSVIPTPCFQHVSR